MITDFRDILFQSNPFLYHVEDWKNEFQLVVFQEFYPNMVNKEISSTLCAVHIITPKKCVDILQFMHFI